eukprot:TRINITY_DN21866_c0_g1_i1.p1 TRINITY_DN21866_c0_g1~~TRINITY_DN21866_c0_g1_i1.p1  ORF type:complete len:566 (+),score=109.87 TRINITY_DN21866_c0_g1_i1:193-1698(+)
MLEEFIRTYGKVNEKDEKVIELYIKGDDEEPVRFEVKLSHKWPKRKVMAELSKILLLETRDESTGEVTTSNLLDQQLSMTLDLYLRVTLKEAKKIQQKRDSLRLAIHRVTQTLQTLYRLKVTTHPSHELTDEYLSNIKFIELLGAQNMKMRNCQIHITATKASRHKIGYLDEDVTNLGILTLSTEHRTLPEIRETWRQEWKHVTNCINWDRLSRAYTVRNRELDLFWNGMRGGCQKVASSKQVAAVACSHVGPILSDIVTPARLTKFKKSNKVTYTGHDFVRIVSLLLPKKGDLQKPDATSTSSSLVPQKQEFTLDKLIKSAARIELTPVELLFPVNIEERPEIENLFGIIIEEDDQLKCKVTHTGNVVVGVTPSNARESGDRIRAAIKRHSLKSAVVSSHWNDVVKKTDEIVKKYNIRIQPSPKWVSTTTTSFSDHYSSAVDKLVNAVGVLAAIGLHKIEIHISDDYSFDTTTGIITIPWDFTLGNNRKSLQAASFAIQS